MATNKRVQFDFVADTSSLIKANKVVDSLFGAVEREGKKYNTYMASMAAANKRTADSVGRIEASVKGLGKAVAGVASIFFSLDFFGEAIQRAMSFIETLNLFEVSLKENIVQARAFRDSMADAFDFDTEPFMKAQGVFNLLSESMGVTSGSAYKMSENLTKLSLDLASLYNYDTTKVMSKMQSGLVGYSRALRDLGINISKDAIQLEAQRVGLNKSVEAMTQAEKMQLRYMAIIRQSVAAQGDFARTIESPANQFRILNEQIRIFVRGVGNALLPAVAAVLPYLNALMRVINMIVNSIAIFFGYTEQVHKAIAAADFADYAYDFDDTSKAMDGATGSAKKLKKELNNIQGFDELNIIKSPTPTPSGAGGAGGAGGGPGFDLSEFIKDYDNKMKGLVTKSDQIVAQILATYNSMVEYLTPMINAIGGVFNAFVDGLMLSSSAIATGWDTAVAKTEFFFLRLIELVRIVCEGPLKEIANTVGQAVGLIIVAGLRLYNEFIMPVADWLTGLVNPNTKAGAAFWKLADDISKVFLTIAQYLSTVDFRAIADKVIELGQTFVDWLLSLDFQPFLTALGNIWKAVEPFAVTIGQGLEWFYLNVLLPLGTWTIEKGLPEFLNAIAKAVEWVNTTINNNKQGMVDFYNNTLVPFANWVVTEGVPKFLEWLGKAIEDVGKFISTNGPSIAKFFTEVLVPLGKNIGEGAISVLKTVADALAGIFKYATENPQGFINIISAIAGLIVAFKSLSEIGAIINILATLNPWMLAIGAAIAIIIALIPTFVANWDSIVSAVSGFFEKTGIGYAFEMMKVYFGWMATAIAPILDVVWKGLQDFFAGVVFAATIVIEVVMWIINAIMIVIAGISNFIVGVVEFFRGVFGVFLDFKQGMTDLLNGVVKMFEGVGQVIFGLIMALVGPVISVVQSIIGFFQWCYDQLVGHSIIPDLVNGIIGFFQFLVDTVVAVIMFFVNLIVDLFKLAWEGIKLAWSGVVWYFTNLWDAVKFVFNGVVTFFTNLFTGAWNGIKAAFATVVSFFTGLWEGIKTAFNAAVTWFSTLGLNIWNAFKGAFDSVTGFFADLWRQIIGKFTDAGTAIGNAVGSAFRSVVNSIFGTVERIVNGFIGLLNRAIDLINKIPGVELGHIGYVDIPRLAEGGIATKPTTAIVGEAGAEAIIPLTKLTGIMREAEKSRPMIDENMLYNAFVRALREMPPPVFNMDSERVAVAVSGAKANIDRRYNKSW